MPEKELKSRQVKVDKDIKFSYQWKESGKGFQIQPPAWSNPFWISTLPDADTILKRVYVTKEIVRRRTNA